jgi:hypothetical protein
MSNFLYRFAAQLIFERPISRKTVGELIERLQKNGEQLHSRFAQLPENDYNRRILSHIIGIERWGQRRLAVLFGESLLLDEYDSYRPAREVPVAELAQQFAETRHKTLEIAHELEQSKKKLTKVPHNQYGELTVRGWLNYLNVHAMGESYKVKK